jgi:hypothetical protein
MPLHFAIDVREGRLNIPEALTEQWAMGAEDVELSLSRVLQARIAWVRGQLDGWVTAALLDRDPSLVARLLMETPAAVLLARRSYAVVHAGTVVGKGGAVVIRGGPGAGKSTLVAAAHRAGFNLLGDETVLVAREHPDDLLAAVRDVNLLEDSAKLLELDLPPAIGRPGSNKLHLDLFGSSSPSARRARRIATVVLGPREGKARLEPLDASTFLEEFNRGEILQEKWSGTPATIATYWARSGAYRLSGAQDLKGAVSLLAELVQA